MHDGLGALQEVMVQLHANQALGGDRDFAATPPIDALKAIISIATTGSTSKTHVVCDVSRAYQVNVLFIIQ